jgi:hypothetical protein
MKCTINTNNEITTFWKDNSTAPKDSLECDKIYPINAFEDSDGVVKYIYKLTNGKVNFTTDGSSYNSLQYSRNRQAEYPSIADQLDDIYHNGVDAWKATIKAVKDKYPKE